MACLKCNSDWVTAMGKNCVSCPHCCKQTKCKERKAGRWVDNLVARICVWCRKSFTPESVHKRTTKVCSPQCKKQHRKHWAKKYQRKYKKEGATQRQLHGKPMPPCKRCGKAVQHRRDNYCGRKCFFQDRRDGSIHWDRTGQELGELQKRRAQGLLMPSAVMDKAIQQAVRQNLNAVLNLHEQLNKWRPCLHCGGPLKDHATDRTMFCSIPCAAAYEHKIQCGVCGKQCFKRGIQGGRGMCDACKRIAHKANRRKGYRRKLTQICTRDGWRCQLCSCRLLKTWNLDAKGVPLSRCRTIDHILPRADGGTDDNWNLQACCYKCNCRKGRRHKGQLRFAM